MKKVFNLHKSKIFWLFILDIVLLLGFFVVFDIFLLTPVGEPDTFDKVTDIILIGAYALAVFALIMNIILSFFTHIIVNEKNIIESKRPLFYKKFPQINLQCEEFVDCELKCNSFKMPLTLTLKTQDNKFDVNLWLFSKKQVLELLQEIQTRGGLQGKTIDKTIFK